MDFLLERKSKFKTYKQDVKYIHDVINYYGNMTDAIEITRKRYLKALALNNVELIDQESIPLEDLINMCKERNIVPRKRAADWHDHEKDVCKGINKLFSDKFFTCNDKEIDAKEFKAELAGGGKQSDIRVVHKQNSVEKDFFVECKLNFESAEYFKFRLTATKDKLIYDHKVFLSGEVKNNKKEVEKV